MIEETKLVDFLLEKGVDLLNEPLSGKLDDIYRLFIKFLETEETARGIGMADFVDTLNTLAEICPGAISTSCDSRPDSSWLHEYRLDSVNLELVGLMSHSLRGERITSVEMTNILAPTRGLDLGQRLRGILETNADDEIDTQLELLLGTKPASFALAKENARIILPQQAFIPNCNDPKHTSDLGSAAQIMNNKLIGFKLSKLSADEIKCMLSKIHYVPNLKPQTNIALGDCSYLDTCHKLGMCRYVHYLQYVPEALQQSVQHEVEKNNSKKLDSKRITFYTHGFCTSMASRMPLPAQWIQCDVRKFDFSVLGKFSVILADPAWNIHMNLPYGTCNDSELSQLPLDLLQDEGIMFLWVTGRAIEMGKNSLVKWGYEVCDEISWIKTNQLGRTIVTGRTGHWLNHSKEHLLVGIKGKAAWLNRQVDIDLIVSCARETSRKPDELYGMIERVVGPHARKLELFGRDHNTRAGWMTIGDQLQGSSIHELDVERKYERFLSHGFEKAPVVV
ncbi:LAMI_0D07536g1_1 [Lachancea mirantina]|uniref:mRNA m(6)A methyltransferase n=1 Tax=Lachancea mirantina TaxID=1230905 RepID=A0A1G4JCF6_9SACH|nr:LAMI_0D07536g1_1 [Lachancea mirantina]